MGERGAGPEVKTWNISKLNPISFLDHPSHVLSRNFNLCSRDGAFVSEKSRRLLNVVGKQPLGSRGCNWPVCIVSLPVTIHTYMYIYIYMHTLYCAMLYSFCQKSWIAKVSWKRDVRESPSPGKLGEFYG